jgi:hypothetical protein
MNLTNALAALRQQDAPAAALRAALAGIDTDAAEAAMRELEEQRVDALLDGSDDDVAAVDERLAVATRAAERAWAARNALERRLAEAERAEEQARLDRLVKDAEKACTRMAKRMEKYDALASALAGWAKATSEDYDLIVSASDALIAAGDPRRVDAPDPEARRLIEDLRIPALRSADHLWEAWK